MRGGNSIWRPESCCFACLNGYGIGAFWLTILDEPLNLKLYLIESAFWKLWALSKRGWINGRRRVIHLTVGSQFFLIFLWVVSMNMEFKILWGKERAPLLNAWVKNTFTSSLTPLKTRVTSHMTAPHKPYRPGRLCFRLSTTESAD